MTIDVPVGASRWMLNIADSNLLTVRPRVSDEPLADPRAALREALEHPLRLGVPLRRALTPDDRIALVIDDRLPKLGEMVAGVLEYLATAGVGPESVTIITLPDSSSTDWIEDLPDEFADVRTEAHQPGDRKQLSYLATTKKGRRVYLNRTLVDADQIISITGRRYDPQFGYAGCECSLYPALSDEETRRALFGRVTLDVPLAEPAGIRAEAKEIAEILGSTIYIQVVEAAGDEIAHICAGLIDTSADGVRLQDGRWRFALSEPVDLVLASLGGKSDGHDFDVMARAVTAASRAVRSRGAIVLLTDAEPAIGEGMGMLLECDDPGEALQLLLEKKPADLSAAFQWASAAAHARLYVGSGINPETVEEMFATPILSPGEVQRLLDRGGKCLHLPDADKSLVVVE
jgi:nickel-dependent lactate racemase